ncbi:hypothetical protein BCV70DRAFT_18701 [Testicularia cyperi]|uniref:Formin binding protein 3 n=1 Tax=Testicularia cyperi TaxID=1882483 RepID=A0A317Y040_9BASI|nr:hypothetical protein BCV70DRAFT_18701 [Testicularia cyperi]
MSTPSLRPDASAWTEHKTAQGRAYWYNAAERRSVWEKPAELKTPRERALDSTPWKEYKSGERSYYVHSVTKQSTWTLPSELKHILDQYPKDAPVDPSSSTAASAAPAGLGIHTGTQSPILPRSPLPVASPAASPFVGSGGFAVGPSQTAARTGSSTPYSLNDSGHHTPTSSALVPPPASSRLPTRPPNNGASASAGAAGSPNPEFDFRGDKQGAEAAFMQLLENANVDVDWTWETTMRAIITDPLYKALKSIAERKAAFNNYVDRLRKKRAEEAAAREQLLLPTFRQIVAGDPRIKSYSSFETAKKWLSHTTGWKEAYSDEEAKRVYEIVMREQKQKEQDAEKEVRVRNMEMLMSLLKTFEADVTTRWRDAHRTVIESPEYEEDPHLHKLEVKDMLSVFEELMRGIEKDAEETRKRGLDMKHRRERKNRDAYKALLHQLRDEGKIHAKSTWGQVFTLVKDDDRFLRVVGQPGSTPLDLFYDVVDDLDLALEIQKDLVLQHVRSRGHELKATTTESEFSDWTKDLPGDVNVSDQVLGEIFTVLVTNLQEEEERRAAEDRRRLERKFRHQIEDLRYAFKKLEPPLDLDAKYNEVIVSRISSLVEYKDAVKDSDEIPRLAWEKFVRRQREKVREKEMMVRDTYDTCDSRKRKEHPDLHGRRCSSASIHAKPEPPAPLASALAPASASAATSAVSDLESRKRARTNADDEDGSELEEGEV